MESDENSETLRCSRRKKGGNKGDSIRNYVNCDIFDDDFEAKAVKFVKSCKPRALTRKESLDTLMLQFQLYKEHAQKRIKWDLVARLLPPLFGTPWPLSFGERGISYKQCEPSM